MTQRGRRVPPKPFDFRDAPDMVTLAVNPTPDELAALTQPSRLLLFQIEHDRGCRAQYTQRDQDCQCSPDVRVLTYREAAG